MGKSLYGQAISVFNRALEINLKYAEAYFNKAVACEKAGRIRVTVEAYKTFIQYASPQDAPHIEHARQRIKEQGE